MSQPIHSVFWYDSSTSFIDKLTFLINQENFLDAWPWKYDMYTNKADFSNALSRLVIYISFALLILAIVQNNVQKSLIVFILSLIILYFIVLFNSMPSNINPPLNYSTSPFLLLHKNNNNTSSMSIDDHPYHFDTHLFDLDNSFTTNVKLPKKIYNNHDVYGSHYNPLDYYNHTVQNHTLSDNYFFHHVHTPNPAFLLSSS